MSNSENNKTNNVMNSDSNGTGAQRKERFPLIAADLSADALYVYTDNNGIQINNSFHGIQYICNHAGNL